MSLNDDVVASLNNAEPCQSHFNESNVVPIERVKPRVFVLIRASANSHERFHDACEDIKNRSDVEKDLSEFNNFVKADESLSLKHDNPSGSLKLLSSKLLDIERILGDSGATEYAFAKISKRYEQPSGQENSPIVGQETLICAYIDCPQGSTFCGSIKNLVPFGNGEGAINAFIKRSYLDEAGQEHSFENLELESFVHEVLGVQILGGIVKLSQFKTQGFDQIPSLMV